MKINSFKDLTVWQKSMTLVKAVYTIADQLPQREQLALASQLRRSAVSIPSNIAEGTRRGTKKDYAQFLKIANGSAAELETQLILTREIYALGNISFAEQLLEEIQKMLNVMIRTLTKH